MKSNRVAKAFLVIFFIGLLATPFAIKRISAARSADKSQADSKTALARHGFYLEEVSHAAGINFVHQSPKLDPKLD
ncbi:MAG: hypothetical protein WAL56_24860, partial [Candidatus Sulfotelmatobacter sp.]